MQIAAAGHQTSSSGTLPPISGTLGLRVVTTQPPPQRGLPARVCSWIWWAVKTPFTIRLGNPMAETEKPLAEACKYLSAFVEHSDNTTLSRHALTALNNLVDASQRPQDYPESARFADTRPGLLPGTIELHRSSSLVEFAESIRNELLPELNSFVSTRRGKLLRLKDRVASLGIRLVQKEMTHQLPCLIASYTPNRGASLVEALLPKQLTGPKPLDGTVPPHAPIAETPFHAFMRHGLEFFDLVQKDAAPEVLSEVRRRFIQWGVTLGKSYFENPEMLRQLTAFLQSFDRSDNTGELSREFEAILAMCSFATGDPGPGSTWYGPLARTEAEIKAVMDRPFGSLVLELDAAHRTAVGVPQVPPELSTSHHRHNTDQDIYSFCKLTTLTALDKVVAFFCKEDAGSLIKLDKRIREELAANPLLSRASLENQYGWKQIAKRSFHHRYKQVKGLPPDKQVDAYIRILKELADRSDISWLKRQVIKTFLNSVSEKFEEFLQKMSTEMLAELRSRLDRMATTPMDKLHSRPIDEIIGLFSSISAIYHDWGTKHICNGFNKFFDLAGSAPEYNEGVTTDTTHRVFTAGIVNRYCPQIRVSERVNRICKNLGAWATQRGTPYLKATKNILSAPLRITLKLISQCIIAPIQWIVNFAISLVMRWGMNKYGISRLMLDKLCDSLYKNNGQSHYSFATRQIILDLLQLIEGAITRSLHPSHRKTDDVAFESVKAPLGELLTTIFHVVSISRYRSQEHLAHVLKDTSFLARLRIELERLAMPEVVHAIVDVLSNLIEDLTKPKILEPLLQSGLRSVMASMEAEGLPLSDHDKQRASDIESAIKRSGDNVIALLIDRAFTIEMTKLFEGNTKEYCERLESLQNRIQSVTSKWQSIGQRENIDTDLLAQVCTLRVEVQDLSLACKSEMSKLDALLKKNPDPANRRRLGILSASINDVVQLVVNLHNRLQLHIERHLYAEPVDDLSKMVHNAAESLLQMAHKVERYELCDRELEKFDVTEMRERALALGKCSTPPSDAIKHLQSQTINHYLLRLKELQNALRRSQASRKFDVLMTAPLDETDQTVAAITKIGSQRVILLDALFTEQQERINSGQRSEEYYQIVKSLISDLLPEDMRRIFFYKEGDGTMHGLLTQIRKCSTIEQLLEQKVLISAEIKSLVERSDVQVGETKHLVNSSLLTNSGLPSLRDRIVQVKQEADAAQRISLEEFKAALTRIADLFKQIHALQDSIKPPKIKRMDYQALLDTAFFREIRGMSFNLAFVFLYQFSGMLSSETFLRLIAHRGMRIASVELGTLRHR